MSYQIFSSENIFRGRGDGLKHLFQICFLLVLGTLSQLLFAANDKTLVWEAKKGDTVLYLFGSIHFGDPSIYPLRQETMAAFQRSDTLVVEVDVTNVDQIAMQKFILSNGVYPQGKSLKDDISPETYKLLSSVLAKLGVPEVMFLQQKPGLAVMSLATMQIMAAGLKPQHGLEFHFLGQSKNKTVISLESLEQQLQLIINMPDADKALHHTLEQMADLNGYLSELLSQWKLGSETALHRLLIEEPLETHPEYKGFFDKIFFERNYSMLEKIEKLPSGQKHFVVVGAGHLLGERGIVALLKDKGYQLKRL